MTVVFFRTLILYIVINIALRIMGKRQIGELQPSEFVVTILISNIATLPIEDTDIPLLAGLIPILTFVVFEVFSSALSMKSITARRIISGNPRVIIRNGEIDQQELKNLRFSVDDLMEQLRISGIFDLDEVLFAIVETTGNVSIMQKHQNRPLTPKDVGIKFDNSEDYLQSVIISDGKVIQNAMDACSMTKQKLDNILKKEKVNAQDIFIMTCNKALDYKIIKKQTLKNKSSKKKGTFI